MDPVTQTFLVIVGTVAIVGVLLVPIAWVMRRRGGRWGLVAAAVGVSVVCSVWSIANGWAMRAANAAPPIRPREILFVTSMFVAMSACGALALEFRFRRDTDPGHRLSVGVVVWGFSGVVLGLLAYGAFMVFVGFEWLMG